MGIVGSQLKPFNATAFHQGKFVENITEETVKGK